MTEGDVCQHTLTASLPSPLSSCLTRSHELGIGGVSASKYGHERVRTAFARFCRSRPPDNPRSRQHVVCKTFDAHPTRR